MLNRDLANYLNNSAGIVDKAGADAIKEQLLKNVIPSRLGDLHREGYLWIHDMAFYGITYNCLGVALDNILENGLKTYDFTLPKTKNLTQALKNTVRLINALTNEQSGGIGIINFDMDIGRYVNDYSDDMVRNELREFLLDLNMYTRRGCEVPYVTLNIGIGTDQNSRKISKLLLEEYGKGFGENKPFIFPNIVFKVKNRINREEGSPNYDLFRLSTQVTSSVMNPTYLNCDSAINKNILPEELGIMGCRSRVANNIHGKPGAINRGNIASVSINLPRIALETKNKEAFLDKLKLLLNESKDILIHRYRSLCKLDTKQFDFIIQNEMYEHSNIIEKAEDFLKNGTLAIGFIGLIESIQIIKGCSKADLDFINHNKDLGMEIVKFMEDEVNGFTEEYGLNFSLLASSGEGISGIFPQKDLDRFGSIKNINDKGFYTNSFHTPVDVEMNYFSKILYESSFHKYCTGGSISYVEFQEIPANNEEAVMEIIRFGMDNDVNYMGINFPLDLCSRCNCKGTFEKRCPICGDSDIVSIRRVSGYLSYDTKFADGKKKELENRTSHIKKKQKSN